MRNISMLSMAMLACFCAFGQASPEFVTSITPADKLSLAKSSIEMPTWHEKQFWSLYDEYSKEMEQSSLRNYRALHALASTDVNGSAELTEYVEQLMQYRAEELYVLKKYYGEIGKDYNGIVALQWLQTETLLDMMENSDIYNKSTWSKFRFQPSLVREDQLYTVKRNLLKKAVGFSDEEEGNFWIVYNDFEEERNALLGNEYDIVYSCAGTPSDYTPAIAKRLGNNLLTILEREQKLKEKYYGLMKEKAGPIMAARFFAWEDFYSLNCKMRAWAE